MPQTILETKDFLILNKPAGLVVHSDGKTDEPTLCDWILENYPETAGVGEPFKLNDDIVIDRPGIVHRLDRETSGVIIVARNQETFEYLKTQFQDRKVEKTYHAFVYGNIKEEERTIDAPIARSKVNFRQWQSGGKTRGELRDALTEFKVLKRSEDKQTTFVEVYPKTGRTHQIRVHMKYIFHPIVCDGLYAPDRECFFDFKRTALHARSVKFIAPGGEDVFAEAEYPEDFAKAIELI